MRKRILAVTMLAIFALSGCGVQDANRSNGGAAMEGAPGAADGVWTDSEIEEIGLTLETGKVTPTGMTMTFRQQGGTPAGELTYGAQYAIERYEDGAWVEVPVTVKGQYAFNLLGYIIELETTTKSQLDWEWLYGELDPGEYRIGKDIHDSRIPGDYDEYMIYAHFEIQ